MLRIDGTAVPRDRWNRPVIDGTTYVRASTLAGALDDKEGLLKWAARQAAIGVGTSPDLVAAVATTKADDTKTLDGIVKQAQERAKSKAGATMGTAIHTATELLDCGESIDILPAEVRADAQAYRAALDAAKLHPLAAECFVVNHALQSAGTFDRLLQGPHKAIISDTKTSGREDTVKWSGIKWAVQLAVYSGGKPWHPDHGIVDWGFLDLPEPSITHGLIVHIVQGQAKVSLYSVDLVAGYQVARLARQVYDARKEASAMLRLVG